MSGNGKVYWRSLEQLADDPQARAFLEREFPENASAAPEGVTRRTMLTLLGASLSMAGLAACRRPVEQIVPYVSMPEQIIPGVPLHYATTMPLGTGGHGLVVESHEGRPTKVEGNAQHPASRGATSAVIQASILNLYDPDRSQGVRNGEQRKTWAEFETAWAELQATYLDNAGEGLAVLTESYSSPTQARLASALRQRFPKARFVVHEPVSDEQVYAGVEAAFGRRAQPVYHFDRARVILSLDSDFLLTESDSIRSAQGFADGRRVASPGDEMNRLYVVESGLSLTGGNADHRLRLAGSRIATFVAELARRLGSKGLSLPGELPAAGSTGREAWIAAVADDLLAARGAGLIVAGRHQPAAVHAAVFALNAALGNVGRTVGFHEMPDAGVSDSGAFADLARAMRDGAVSCLFVLGGNPVYTAAADLEFPQALDQVEQVIHLGPQRDETARRSAWHLPQSHYLEAWGDVRAFGGALSVTQPLIAPLFDSRSAIELLGLLATGGHVAGHELVRETWRAVPGEGDFEKRWNRALHDGVLAGSASDPLGVAVRADAFSGLAAGRPAGSDLEIVFRASPALFDGRWANNGWLQELPDAVTKLTWDNAALLSPATAARLGVGNEDVVHLSYEGRQVEAPVYIVPGQADDTVQVDLGHGRAAAGRVGDDRGFNAFALRTSAAPDFGQGATLEPTGRTYPLATTQDHYTVDEAGIAERAARVPVLIRESTIDAYREHPDFVDKVIEHPPLKSIFPDHSYAKSPQWGMTIDLNVCTGCNACVTACQSENNIPIVGKEQVKNGREMHWLRIDRYFNGAVEDPQTVFQPVPCMHCENAPCEQVCPVAATVHDAEGLNTMVYNRCIGTRYCSNNCPYKVRRFNFFNFTKDTPEIQQMVFNPDVTVRSRGVMEKCTYCTQRINATKINAKLEGRELADGDVQTACQQACPSRAITFGNIRDEGSEVSRAKAQDRNYEMIAELNNRPRTSFLAKLRNPNPALVAE